MGETTGISWCSHTHNLWWGCTKVGGSPACDHCYAETLAHRFGYEVWGDDKGRRYFGEKHIDELSRWDRKAVLSGEVRRVFVMSMGDWAEGRPEQAEHLRNFWDRAATTSNLIYLMLTKRPQLIRKLCALSSGQVWHGVTAETQAWLDLRWKILREVESAVYWLSMEPLMEQVTLPDSFLSLGQRAWCIVGGESGSLARPMSMKWVRRLRDQCKEAGVPFHFKQGSQHNWGPEFKKFDGFPEDLKIREAPPYPVVFA